MSRPQGHSAAGRIMTRSEIEPATFRLSALPQPTVPPRDTDMSEFRATLHYMQLLFNHKTQPKYPTKLRSEWLC